jgi:hypothetical protein
VGSRGKGQLWKPISRVLLVFCSAYIYSFEWFFSQHFNDVLANLIRFVVFEI